MDEKAYLDQIAAFLAKVRERAANGTTVSELTQSTVDAMRLVMTLLEAVNSMTGAEKKAEVLKLVLFVFDTYSDACVPLLARPFWWAAKPIVRSVIVQVASGLVESLLANMRAA